MERYDKIPQYYDKNTKSSKEHKKARKAREPSVKDFDAFGGSVKFSVFTKKNKTAPGTHLRNQVNVAAKVWYKNTGSII